MQRGQHQRTLLTGLPARSGPHTKTFPVMRVVVSERACAERVLCAAVLLSFLFVSPFAGVFSVRGAHAQNTTNALMVLQRLFRRMAMAQTTKCERPAAGRGSAPVSPFRRTPSAVSVSTPNASLHSNVARSMSWWTSRVPACKSVCVKRKTGNIQRNGGSLRTRAVHASAHASDWVAGGCRRSTCLHSRQTRATRVHACAE